VKTWKLKKEWEGWAGDLEAVLGDRLRHAQGAVRRHSGTDLPWSRVPGLIAEMFEEVIEPTTPERSGSPRKRG
jgi:hypothetical protein